MFEIQITMLLLIFFIASVFHFLFELVYKMKQKGFRKYKSYAELCEKCEKASVFPFFK